MLDNKLVLSGEQLAQDLPAARSFEHTALVNPDP
jgi:hypothetical protein